LAGFGDSVLFPLSLDSTAWLFGAVINWFNAKIRYADILPIRASAYILSLVNEQVSKGAIALYLNRRDGLPGWEIGSSMLFIMFCEYYSLMLWASIGVLLRWNNIQNVFHIIPWIALGSCVFFVFFHLFFSGKIGAGMALRERPIFRAFRLAKVWHYGAVIAMRAPLVIAGVIVYTLALRLFGGTVGFGEMLGYLPVIFFGAAMPGPMHSVAILFWVLLFPDKPGQMTAFGFVMHNFFIFFNAGVGLLFLRRASSGDVRVACRTSDAGPWITECSEPASRPGSVSKGAKRVQSQSNENLPYRRDEIQHAVVAAEFAPAEPGLCR
jgi:hypothetical protein